MADAESRHPHRADRRTGPVSPPAAISPPAPARRLCRTRAACAGATESGIAHLAPLPFAAMYTPCNALLVIRSRSSQRLIPRPIRPYLNGREHDPEAIKLMGL